MSRYETAIDLGDPNNSQTQLITLAGRDQVVLDVGCAAGDTAAALVRRGCTVSGVDVDAEASAPAREVLAELVVADLDRSPLTEHFKPQSFDVVLFGDVLEHLLDPAAALRDAAGLLRPGGRIIVSIPNVAHGSVRLALLTGHWDPTDTGLLDRTHLHFFTLDGVLDLLEGAGLVVDELRSTVLDPLAVREIELRTEQLPPTMIDWVRRQDGALDYQYVAVAHPLAAGETRPRRPQLAPALAYDQARLRDEWSEEVQEVQDQRHRVLTQRDHIIGLEAKAAAEGSRSYQNLRRAKQAERKFRTVRNELEDVATRLVEIAEHRRPQAALEELVTRIRAQVDAVGGRTKGKDVDAVEATAAEGQDDSGE